MSQTTPRRPRRPARTAALGALAVTAAVALPAFAIERSGDDDAADAATEAQATADAQAAAEAAEAAKAAAEAKRAADEQFFTAAWTAQQQDFWSAYGSASPEEQYSMRLFFMSPEEAYNTQVFVLEMARQEGERAEAARREAAERAEAARRQAAQAAQAAQSSSRGSSSGGGGGASVPGGVWDTIAQCESSGNWAMNSGNGFYGGLQFHPGTWRSHGGTAYAEYAHQATKAQQIEIAQRVLASQGWGAWPACSARAGLR